MLFLVALLVASPCCAQLSLDVDLDRAAARYAPAATPAPDEVNQLMAEASERYRSGRIDGAVAALDRAAGIAFRSEATGRAFELSLTAAEMLRKAGRADEATERFQQAALSNARDPRAALTHWAAIETLATTLDGAASERLDFYAKLVDQHLGAWPQSPTADPARWERVELLARRRRWSELLEAARAVDKDDSHWARSRELLVAAFAGLLAADPSTQRFDAARDELQPLVFADPTRWPDEWSPLQRDAVLVLARGAVDLHAEGLDYGKRLLRQALEGRPAPDRDWQRRAAVTLAVATLAGGELAEADAWLRTAYDGSPEHRQKLLQAARGRLMAHTRVSEEADRLLESVGAIEGEVRHDARTAAALVDAGRTAEARRVYEKLAAERPDDRGVQAAYARLLGVSESVSEREAALGRWRLIETRSEAGSDGWFEARLERLRLLVKLDKRDDAKKLLALTRLLAPTLGGDERRVEFEQIAQQLEATSQ